MSVTVTGTKRHLDLNASTLTTTGNITAGGNIILSGSSNEIIKSNGSIRLNIDSDNNQGDRIFIVSHHNNTELFRVDEGGHGIFQGNATADSFIKSGGTSSQFLMADGSVSTSVTDSTKLPLAGGTMTGTLTNTQNGGTASIYINSTRPTLGFTDSNSFTDSNDVYIVRGTGGNKLQFQWYDNSAGTTTETFNIDNSGAATFAGSVTATQLDLENMGNYITFYGGGQTNHSIASRQLDGGTGDDIRLNTYGSFIVNLDSNNNQSTAANSSFFIGRHGGSASAISGTNLLFQIDGQTGNVLPGADSTHDLGTSSNRWANVYADTLYGDGSNLTGITASNADTVDNLHAASFLRSDADDTATGQIRIASSGAEEGKLIVGSSSQTNYVLQQWQTSSHGTNNAYIIAYGASHGSQAGNFAIKNTLANKNIFFEVNNAVPLKLENGTSTFTGNIAVSGTVDGRDIATDGTKLDTIDTNADVTPSWVPSSDPSYLTSSSTQSKYLRSDAADTGTGIITLSQNNATTPYPLIVQNASNADGVGIEFSDNSAGSQRGYITHFHADSKSYGSGASMIISSSEATTTILADGKLMYGEGIYSKPTSGTGAGTRKDQNWDTAYSWGNHASAGYLTTSSASTTYLAKSGGTMGGAINMSNFNITGVNVLTFNDPGPNEGISWSGGNTKIYESPNNLTSNTAGNLQFVYGSTRRLTVNNTGIDVNGNITVSGTVDGRDIATDGTKLDTIDTNADVTPSWVPSSDPSYLTSSSTQSKYLRSDAADTGTGIITLSQNNATTPYPLIVQNASNADGVGIEFSDNSAGSQRGYITHFHADSKSYGSGASMIISSSEATTTILADGKLMYGEGIYSKPTSGTGAGTRKDQNWDTAYSWGNHASAGYLTTSSASTTYLAKSGGTMGGAINMSNFNITGVNVLTFNDPGPNEGISWSGGNTKIYESPNDLTTNTAGNLQFVYGSTRRLTVNSGGIDVNGNIVVSGTVDGVDIATRDGVLTSTTTTANAALPKAGGTMTGDINLSSGSASIKKTANTSGNYPAIELYSSGTSDSGAAIAIQQATSEGDTIIFADYEPHVEWGISAENGANEIHFTAGSSTNSLGSKTFKNNAGSNRTAYKKMTINLSSGNVAIGGTLAVSGTFSASGYNKSNWDTAYGWGNHADEGYLTSFDITTQTDSKYIRSNANDNVTGHTEWQDGYHVRLGNGADMRLYHSSGNNYIDCHTGSLYIRTNANTDVGGDIHLRPRSSENGIIIKDDAEVELYYNNALKMETTSGGISVQGSVTASGGNVGNLNTGSDIGQQMEYGSTSAATLRCDADRWRVYMGGGGQAREALTVLETGNVGVGDSTPSYKLDVAGTIRATGDVIAYSDERLKENIKTIDNSLEKVNKLRGVEFNKIGEDKKSIGVIAQEIENIIPEVVKTDDQGMKSVAYGNVVGLLIESIKELNKEVEELKTKLNNGN